MRYLILFILLFTFRASMALETEIYNATDLRIEAEGNPIVKDKKQKKIAKAKAKIEDKIAKLIQSQLLDPSRVSDKNKRSKVGVIVMAILTGPLGGHRLYLGTKPYVPIIYALTLGGGFGLLPLIDIIMILSSKDISKFENNDHIMMWADL